MRIIFTLLLLTGVANAQTAAIPINFYRASFGGVDNYHDSARIDEADFQDARNILTDRGYIEKRFGSTRVIDAVQSGYPINYVKEFITQSNVKKFLIQTSTIIYATDFSASPVQIATVNVNGITSSVSAYNKHYFVNGYDTAFSHDGTNVVLTPEIPTGCKYLIFADECLWCANVSGLESTVYKSAYGDPTDWTIPATDPLPADAANAFTMDRQDGKPLTCAYYSPYGKIFWKRNKMFVVRGVDNDDYAKYRLSDNVGCVDNRSVRLVNGVVTWLAEDGIYQWEGGSNPPTLISREIDPTVKSIRQSVSAADNQAISSYADFLSGSFETNGTRATWDATANPGYLGTAYSSMTDTLSTDFGKGALTQVVISTDADSVGLGYSGFSTLIDTFTDEDYTSAPTWTCTGDCAVMSAAEPFYQKALYMHIEAVSKAATFSTPYVSRNYGQWKADFKHAYTGSIEYVFVSSTNAAGTTSGYSFMVTGTWNGGATVGTAYLYKITDGAKTPLASSAYTATNSSYIIDRNESGGMTVRRDGARILTATDTVHMLNPIYVLVAFTGTGYANGVPPVGIDNIYGAAQYYTSGSYTSRTFDTGFLLSIGGPMVFEETIPVGTTVAYYAAESDTDSGFTSWTTVNSPTSGSFRLPFTKRYYKYKFDLSTTISTQTPTVNLVQLSAVSTGTWSSPVLYMGTEMSSWGQFAAVDTSVNSSARTYYTRASMTVFDKDAATPAWVEQPNNVNVACSTGVYTQVRAVSLLGSATDTFLINSFTFNWYNGDSKSVASLYWDGRYYLCANTSSNTLTNDLCMVYQRNKKWTLFDGQSWGALDIYNNYPYAGDGLTSSKIWRIIDKDIYYDDNIEPINAYAITKDFQFDGQNNNKILRQFYLEAAPNTESTLSLAYSVDKSTTYYTTSQALQVNVPFNDEIKGMFPGFAKGRYARFKFSNNIVNQNMKLDAYTVLGDIERLYRR